jgi:colanic acid biosynthesis glycosyl transferase WcaI
MMPSPKVMGGFAKGDPKENLRRRLCIVTQWYPPEQAPFGQMMCELAEELASRGWDVTVITAFPSHPHGVILGGYRKKWMLAEQVNCVRVWRVWTATSPRRSLWNRALGFLTFTISSAMAMAFRARFDLIFAVLQPLTVGLTIPLIAKIRGARVVFNIQDLHPDTQIKLGMIRNSLLICALRRLESHAYRTATRVTVISRRFMEHCIRRGADPKHVTIIENWIDTQELKPMERNNSFRREAGCQPDDFVVLWAGTLGYVSGVAVVIDTAEALSSTQSIRFVVVGNGPLRNELLATAKDRRLTNVVFMNFQDRGRLPEVQAIADLSLVTLGRDFGESSVPSKVLGYMAAGRPVLASVPESSETAELIRRAGCGLIVEPNDSMALARAVLQLVNSPDLAVKFGARAREYAVRYLSKASAVERYERLFREIVS